LLHELKKLPKSLKVVQYLSIMVCVRSSIIL